jgi:hypothetical protein
MQGISDPAEIVGKTDFDMPWAEATADSFRSLDRQIIESGQPEHHVIHYVVTANDRTSWIDTNKVPLRNTVRGNYRRGGYLRRYYRAHQSRDGTAR